MSRLTMSPFHKPSPFEFPRAPISPPETHSDTFVAHTMPVPVSMPAPSTHILAGQDYGMPDVGASTSILDSPRVKRPSSIPYHHSNASRENKDRVLQKNGKTLILVIPPSTLIQENGRLSHNPYHRLSQGVVVPLLPSMFAQLTAIAREFNFPSTTGLCLYYHYNEDGLTFTPRISDDSWQTFWAHHTEPSQPNERRALVGARVEFDIDLRLARWYSAWLSALQREYAEHPSYYPSTAPSLAHFRGESSATGGRPFDDEPADIQQHSAPVTTRHVPRKLSLVERYDSSSTRGETRTTLRSSAVNAEAVPGPTHVLSPIVQEEEPRTARQYLDNRVNSWRASAIVEPTLLAATGQTSLDPPNLPNNMPIDSLIRRPDSPTLVKELNLEEYTWSVSSLGPQSLGSLSPLSQYHVPSVHLANRLEGSVGTTASICTSFGPADDEYFVEYAPSSRILSPDIAHRFFEDSPLSPMTTTSWGAPLSYPPSPDNYAVYPRIPTPDVAQRFYEDCPPSPMTATSWGPPSSYPPSPRCISPVPSLDLGERCMPDDFHGHAEQSRNVKSSISAPWSHVWPYNKQSSSTPLVHPWSYVWPYTAARSSKQAAEETISAGAATGGAWLHVWPYNAPVTRNSCQETETKLTDSLDRQSSFVYPYVNIYRPVYPFFDIYPEVHRSTQPSSKPSSTALTIDPGHSFVYPYINIYRPVYPFLDLYPEVHVSRKDRSLAASNGLLHEGHHQHCSFVYPYINIYRPVYPFLDIYPAVHVSSKNEIVVASKAKLSEDHHSFVYPYINIYRPVYPFLDIYPAVHVSQKSEVVLGSDVHHSSVYPYINIYRPVYPFFELYPPVHVSGKAADVVRGSKAINAISVKVPATYPTFDLYPAVYPANLDCIYPTFVGRKSSSVDLKYGKNSPALDSSVNSSQSSRLAIYHSNPRGQYPHFDLYPETNLSRMMRTSELTVQHRRYPVFNIYPAVYPHFDLYPTMHKMESAETSVCVGSWVPQRTSVSQYPTFNLYPAVYPYFDLYPALPTSYQSPSRRSVAPRDAKAVLTPVLPPMYPSFNLYPSVYPYLTIYPASYGVSIDQKDANMEVHNGSICSGYPYFNLYPAVYPYLEIYPAPYGEDLDKAQPSKHAKDNMSKSRAESRYPYFNLYPGVYPHLDIYPAGALMHTSRPLESTSLVVMPRTLLQFHYPYFNLYPPVYPTVELYPPLPQMAIDPPERPSVKKKSTRLTHAELHAMVMMESFSASLGHSSPLRDMAPSSLSTQRVEDQGSRLPLYGNLSRPTLPSSPSPRFRESRQLSANLRSGSTIFLPRSNSPSPVNNSPPRRSVNFQEIQRFSSLREQPEVRTSMLPKPGPLRRDSVVMQRARAFDSNAEDSTGISRETLSKFPMPPRAFPPLPPLPVDRGH
ncbi:hypothetical protein D9613_005039 [Agrocybe pediades]|uniref:Uncharacterized protein n=1 Tax=Agrocybe pediades TaxID=84607 RepID=A0A8H4VR31_9AGAR|nr:hypothetical protein D9613_005039 [Agrocybe pediades]